MSDEVFPTPTRQIDIPSRFIRQAMDHVEHTGNRYVTFLFTGEQVIDAICVGVTTRLLIAGPTARPTAQPPTQAKPTMPSGPWTISSLTSEVILAQVEEHGPINVRQLGNNLGIAGSNISLRQRIRRVLESLLKQSAIRKVAAEGAMPDYVSAARKGPLMPLRTRSRSGRVARKDITPEKLLDLIGQSGRISSRSMGDALNIPRPDTLVRGKITQLVHELITAGRIRICEGTEEGGGRRYELVHETAAEA